MDLFQRLFHNKRSDDSFNKIFFIKVTAALKTKLYKI